MAEGGSVDYEAVLEDLRAKRDRLDAAIAGIEAMLGIRGLASDSVKQEKPTEASSLGPGAFLGMTIVDATKKYLAHKRQNQKTEDVLKALTDGGLVLTGESPINVVGSVLNRNFNSGGDIVKVSRGVWGLAEWHPRLKKKPADAKNGNGSPQGAAQTGTSEASSDVPIAEDDHDL